MKFCSFPGFFHILAKSPGVPPTAFHSRPYHPVTIIWSEGESTTYCPRTIGADPLVRQRDFGGAATTPGGSLGEAREELRRLLLEEAWEARQGWRRLLLETLPEMLRDPAQTFAGRQRPKMVRRGSDDHSWRNLAGKTPESSCKHKNRKKPWGGPQALTWSGSLLSPIYKSCAKAELCKCLSE